MSKEFLKEGDRVYCTGVYLVVQPNGQLAVDGIEEDAYFDGMPVCYDDETGQFYQEDDD